jgi:hypothetical protein
MECRRVCHVNGAAGHCRLVEGIPLLQLGEDVKFRRYAAWLISRRTTADSKPICADGYLTDDSQKKPVGAKNLLPSIPIASHHPIKITNQ